MNQNLWPDFAVESNNSTPKSLVDEAGVQLKEKTNGRIWMTHMTTQIVGAKATATYGLYVPKLSYVYPFLKISMSLPGAYPVEIVPDKMNTVLAGNENELINALREIFKSEPTVNTINSLLAIAA